MWHTVRSPGEGGMSQQGRPGSSTGDRDTRETSPTAVYNPYFTGRPRTPGHATKPEAMDRHEIIRQIKGRVAARQRSSGVQGATEGDAMDTGKDSTPIKTPPALLPSPQIESTINSDLSAEWAASGLAISRPRSALHKGDFREEAGAADEWQDVKERRGDLDLRRLPQQDFVATSPPAPWHAGFPNSAIHRARQQQVSMPDVSESAVFRPRAISQASSLSRSFTYQAPTSPLVHQSNAEDGSDPEDFSLPNPGFLTDRFSRRRTYSPRSLSGFANMLEHDQIGQGSYSPPSIRRESTFPYKAHQPRRSAASLSSLSGTPRGAGRRASIIGSSPLQNPMVGSFEESILRGRMSSTPSRPLDFTAHIGVLGTGECRPSLKCPPHMVIPFPAVFYSYGNGNNNSDSQPSPYVGLVDLENSAHAKADSTAKRKTKNPRAVGSDVSPPPLDGAARPVPTDLDRRKRRQRERRRSRSPLSEPRGGYRIPPQGQLQIVIKNPNKTAVKLFLVPYDVSDMQSGQKTFIRQRSYSAGPIIDMPMDARKNLGTDRPEASLASSEDPKERPVLRYLVHLHICCTAKGRIYLYKSIRVVFANRVPDGKEKLRNEVQLPEPRYSSYKPGKTPSTSTNNTPQKREEPCLDPLDPPMTPEFGFPAFARVPVEGSEAQSTPATSMYDRVLPHRRTDHSYVFPLLETVASRPTSRGWSEEQDSPRSKATSGESAAETVIRVKSPKSPLSPLLSPRQRPISPFTDTSEGTGSITFSRSNSSEKLPGVRAQSLLSRRLRDLERMREQAGSPPANN